MKYLLILGIGILLGIYLSSVATLKIMEYERLFKVEPDGSRHPISFKEIYLSAYKRALNEKLKK